jgi:hypothetical protein
MKPYNPKRGVPLFSYYLSEILSFGDFECPQEERILFTSRRKNRLLICVLKKVGPVLKLEIVKMVGILTLYVTIGYKKCLIIG